MLERLKSFDFMHGVAMLTWAAVAGSCLYYVSANNSASSATMAASIVLFGIFIVAWLYATEPLTKSTRKRIISLAVQWCCFTALFWLLPYPHLVILSILWSGVLPYLMSLKRSLLVTALCVYVPFLLIFHFHWQFSSIFVSGFLYYTFNIFALVMTQTSNNERAAKEQAQLLNAELKATQTLLQQATQESERIRISRNIHDLLGHHLTALIIKLQYVSHTADKESKASVDECLQISRLLLSDVREAVSDMRNSKSMDLRDALHTMINSTPRLNITFTMSQDIDIQDVAIAQSLVRSVQESITNTLKHSFSEMMSIDISQHNGQLHLVVKDESTGSGRRFVEGNGLLGIRERLAQLGGSVSFDATAKGFITEIVVPLEST